MGQIFLEGGAGGAFSEDCTGLNSQCLAGNTYITSNSNDEPINGTIITRSNNDNIKFDKDKTLQKYDFGYYYNNNTVYVDVYVGEQQ